MGDQATLTAEQRRNVVFARDLGKASREFTKDTPDGKQSFVIEGKPIFRSGEFSDSMGRSHLWEELHIQQMVDHYELLSGNGTFSDVPIRKGHPDHGGLFSGSARNAMDELIGYMSNLRAEKRTNPVDKREYTYLLADFEIIEETAIRNVKSGLWRNVSAEISTFVTNNNAEYWPVMYGVAYVDIPAVEGLKSEHSKNPNSFSIFLEESAMGDTPGTPAAPGTTVEHGKPGGTPAPMSFSIGGKTVTDPVAIQTAITELERSNSALETFRQETLANARTDFIKKAISDNKIAAPQEESYTKFAEKLTDEQFSAWREAIEASQPLSVTGPQGAGFSQTPAQAPGENGASEIDTLKGIVSSHKLGQMAPEKIKQTGSYKRLLELDPSFTL